MRDVEDLSPVAVEGVGVAKESATGGGATRRRCRVWMVD
jgi:hypothetical protein